MIYSVNLLQKAENLALAYGGGDSGYYLAFSAGKDSQALYHIAELAGVKFDAHMNLTSVDPPEVIRFVKQSYPEVDLIKPKKSIYQHALKMTIKIEDGIDDLTAISLVKQVIEQGKISNNGNSYCYLTLFGDICVETRQYRKSPCFRVYKK